MKWGIISKTGEKRTADLAQEVYDFLSEQGEVFVETQLADSLQTEGYSSKEINDRVDIVATIGGDGTILRALQNIEKPVFAINSGGMGFLTEVESKYAIDGLKKVLNGNYNVEERVKLKVTLDGKRLPDAANEITVQTGRIAKILSFQVFVDDELIETLKADGIIIATPTGSTSYAMSAGGPVLDPLVEAVVVTFLAPFKLSARPWVIPNTREICIQLLPKSKDSKLVIDGGHVYPITSKNKVCATASEKKARFVRFGESFYQTVRLKLIR